MTERELVPWPRLYTEMGHTFVIRRWKSSRECVCRRISVHSRHCRGGSLSLLRAGVQLTLDPCTETLCMSSVLTVRVECVQEKL